jgi:hypothetical protein
VQKRHSSGFRIARFLRQSLRHSVRRFRGETLRRSDGEAGVDNFCFQVLSLTESTDIILQIFVITNVSLQIFAITKIG